MPATNRVGMRSGAYFLMSAHQLTQSSRWQNFDSQLLRWPERAVGTRWRSWLVGGVSQGRLRAGALVRLPGAGMLRSSALLAPAWDLTADDGRTMIVGSLFRKRGGLQLRAGNQPDLEQEAVRRILQQIAAECGDGDFRIVFPNVPSSQVAVIASAFSSVVVSRAAIWAEYQLGTVQTVEQFTASLDGKKRASWRDRRKHFAKLGWQTSVTEPTDELVRTASELIAEVNLRNGTPDSPAAARARTTLWWRDLPALARAITVTDTGGRLMGVCFARTGRGVLELQEVGIDGHAVGSSDAYVLTTVFAALDLAVSGGTAVVSAGYGHTDIKGMYGATLSADYHLTADLRDLES